MLLKWTLHDTRKVLLVLERPAVLGFIASPHTLTGAEEICPIQEVWCTPLRFLTNKINKWFKKFLSPSW
jgi:hypothetical protein